MRPPIDERFIQPRGGIATPCQRQRHGGILELRPLSLLQLPSGRLGRELFHEVVKVTDQCQRRRRQHSVFGPLVCGEFPQRPRKRGRGRDLGGERFTGRLLKPGRSHSRLDPAGQHAIADHGDTAGAVAAPFERHARVEHPLGIDPLQRPFHRLPSGGRLPPCEARGGVDSRPHQRRRIDGIRTGEPVEFHLDGHRVQEPGIDRADQPCGGDAQPRIGPTGPRHGATKHHFDPRRAVGVYEEDGAGFREQTNRHPPDVEFGLKCRGYEQVFSLSQRRTDRKGGPLRGSPCRCLCQPQKHPIAPDKPHRILGLDRCSRNRRGNGHRRRRRSLCGRHRSRRCGDRRRLLGHRGLLHCRRLGLLRRGGLDARLDALRSVRGRLCLRRHSDGGVRWSGVLGSGVLIRVGDRSDGRRLCGLNRLLLRLRQRHIRWTALTTPSKRPDQHTRQREEKGNRDRCGRPCRQRRTSCHWPGWLRVRTNEAIPPGNYHRFAEGTRRLPRLAVVFARSRARRLFRGGPVQQTCQQPPQSLLDPLPLVTVQPVLHRGIAG